MWIVSWKSTRDIVETFHLSLPNKISVLLPLGPAIHWVCLLCFVSVLSLGRDSIRFRRTKEMRSRTSLKSQLDVCTVLKYLGKWNLSHKKFKKFTSIIALRGFSCRTESKVQHLVYIKVIWLSLKNTGPNLKIKEKTINKHKNNK